jgi:hypothetical protein
LSSQLLPNVFPALGMSATRLYNGSFQASHNKQQRPYIVARLLAQGLVVLIVAFGWWGMVSLGSSTLASQSNSLTAARSTIYVAGCPVPDPLGKSSARGGVGEGIGCSEEGSSHPITSRRPGGGLEGHAHGAEGQREDKVPPRTSSDKTSLDSFGPFSGRQPCTVAEPLTGLYIPL